MSDDFEGDGDADVNDATGESGNGDAGASAYDVNAAGDGLPGFPIPGFPDWRAGAGSGNGVLGMMKLADSGAPASAAAPQGGAIDWNFIHGREAAGGPGLTMSVPEDQQHHASDQSGPTVGYGFDVGQRSVDDLRKLGLSQRIINALTPYTGMKGDKAQAYVAAHPLTLDRSDIDEIDRAVENQTAQNLASKFDAASRIGSFASLPANTQTAIADLFHQYGANDPAAAAPNFWRQATGGDWQGAYDNLQAFHDHFRTRRRSEAGLLKKDIDAGILPPGRSR